MITFVAKITTRMKRLLTLLLIGTIALSASAQTEVTTSEASSLYKSVSKRRVSIHDPSVVYEPTSKRYYIFGSHKAGAYTTDLQNWTQANPTWSPNNNSTAFVTPAVKTVKKGGVDVDFPQFNAMEWSARTDASYNIDGNMWAPDVIWNEKMQKWCMYLSINGDAWHSSIVLLTADKITGPYLYQGPVVICGFQDSGHSYKDTDLELVLGTLSSLPSRYNVGSNWGRRWPHTIDPAVFYDEDGKLWMVYGSWSGGIWVLELDEETGLRDYDVTYPSTNGSSDGVTSDPYFGTKIGGGYYVSGEGSYIEHIGNYYYLFVSYGFFSPDGGYEMRVFRSDKPNGPYRDAASRSAVFSSYVMNYGTGSSDMRGEKIMGAYNGWGFQTVGECAQGHNSIIAAEDGRTYLVCHTKFNDGTAGHQVRVHQLFQNKNGWLVTAPFEYNGETITDTTIAKNQPFTAKEMAGTYSLLIHKYRMDYANMEEVTPVTITLTEDGKVTGSQTGTWSIEEGTGYITVKLGSVTYNGVVFEETMDTQNLHAVAITAMATSGVNIWAYKMMPKYELAYAYRSIQMPSVVIRKDIDLYAIDYKGPNTTMQWLSSEPSIISDYGKYNPSGLTANKTVKLTLHLETGDYYLNNTYNATAYSEANAKPSGDYQTGMVAHYGFDDDNLSNTFDATQKAQLLRNGTTALPTIESGDPMRTEKVLHLNFGANGKESYVSMPNPLYGRTLEKGATISFWVKRTDDNLWDDLFAFVNGDARFYMTGNVYIGYNDGAGKWLDINQSASKQTGYLPVGKWKHVTIAISRTDGISIYVDGGTNKTTNVYNGEIDGKSITTKAGFDYNYIVDHLAACPELFLGKGSFWGSADVRLDDVIVYDKPLTYTENSALSAMASRVYDFRSLVDTGIDDVVSPATLQPATIYDLQGRRIEGQPKRGLYIIGGKKVIVK